MLRTLRTIAITGALVVMAHSAGGEEQEQLYETGYGLFTAKELTENLMVYAEEYLKIVEKCGTMVNRHLTPDNICFSWLETEDCTVKKK